MRFGAFPPNNAIGADSSMTIVAAAANGHTHDRSTAMAASGEGSAPSTSRRAAAYAT